MEEEKEENQIKTISCEVCNGSGVNIWKKCSNCKAMQFGFSARGNWLFWSYPITREHAKLYRGRKILEKIRLTTAFVLGLASLGGFGYLMYITKTYEAFFISPEYWPQLYLQLSFRPMLLFWVTLICFIYIWYRSIRQKEFLGEVEKYNYEWQLTKQQDLEISDIRSAGKVPRRKKHNIARAYTNEALEAVIKAYELADKKGNKQVTALHIFYVMFDFIRVENIFIRLGISGKMIQKQLDSVLPKIEDYKEQPILSEEAQKVILLAYESAYNHHMDFVSITELLVMSVRSSEVLTEMMFDLGIDQQKLENVVQWVRIREKLHHQYIKFSRAAAHRSKHGMDKAMTAVATPYLNNFSDDMTMLAQFGHLETCVARDKIWDELFRVVEGGRSNIMLVGDHGVGKSTIVGGLAQKMVTDDVPKRLQDKRLVKLNISSLLAGTTPAGAVERLQRMMHEMGRAGNIILYIHNIHELIGVSAGTGQGALDVSDTLVEYLSSSRFLTIADTTSQFFAQLIVNSSLGNVFSKVDVEEMGVNQAIQVLESRAGMLEYRHKVFFAYNSIEKSVELAKRYLHDTYLPGNALEIMTEAASLAKSKKGLNTMVTADEVAAVVAEKTNIPVTSVTSDESDKLLRLESEMHERVIGQHEAVDSVANALRRARVEIRATNRPIANFLFLGPTGVGKTELSKTISEVYFGGEERMIRIDMSEYQDNTSIYRLIGQPGQKGTGILTEAVRQNAFSLVLFDEIEKADPNVLNLFLQIMDDGRLTDSTGRVVDFTNVIIIATSNAGTNFVQDQIREGISSEVIKEKLMHGELRNHFRPEFLNRFDGVVLFKALEKEDIRQIAGLMLKRIGNDLEKKGMEMIVEDAALDYLAEVGFDPEFGARPMRRALQDKVENKLAEMLLSGKLKRRDKVVIGQNGEIRVG